MTDIIPLLTIVVSIILTTIAVIYQKYTQVPKSLLTSTYQSFMFGGLVLVTIHSDIVPPYVASFGPIQRTGVYVLGGILSAIFIYLGFIYSHPFDRLYPKGTVKIWSDEDISDHYMRASVIDIDKHALYKNPDESFLVEIHDSKQKWFGLYTDKSDLSDELINSQYSSKNCWKCNQTTDQIALKGVKLNQYPMKSSILDSRDERVGSAQAFICKDCSVDLVDRINEKETITIEQSELLAAGI